jgi:hypothetical protein
MQQPIVTASPLLKTVVSASPKSNIHEDKKKKVEHVSLEEFVQDDYEPKGKKKDKKKPIRKEKKAALTFPVTRIHNGIRNTSSLRVETTAAVFMTATLEYMVLEIFDTIISGMIGDNEKRKRITPRMISFYLNNDQEFVKLLGEVLIREGGSDNKIWYNLLESTELEKALDRITPKKKKVTKKVSKKTANAMKK